MDREENGSNKEVSGDKVPKQKKTKWEPRTVEVHYEPLSSEEYNLLLDEWATTVYWHLCELTKREETNGN